MSVYYYDISQNYCNCHTSVIKKQFNIFVALQLHFPLSISLVWIIDTLLFFLQPKNEERKTWEEKEKMKPFTSIHHWVKCDFVVLAKWYAVHWSYRFLIIFVLDLHLRIKYEVYCFVLSVNYNYDSIITQVLLAQLAHSLYVYCWLSMGWNDRSTPKIFHVKKCPLKKTLNTQAT